MINTNCRMMGRSGKGYLTVRKSQDILMNECESGNNLEKVSGAADAC